MDYITKRNMKAKHDVDIAATGKTAQERPRIRPTELEMCVLAIVSESGPCTAYSVARSLESSVSSFWSSSSGSVYPLLSRLLRRRWVTASRHDWGKREKVRFVPTREGRRLLDAWLGAPLPGWAASTRPWRRIWPMQAAMQRVCMGRPPPCWSRPSTRGKQAMHFSLVRVVPR